MEARSVVQIGQEHRPNHLSNPLCNRYFRFGRAWEQDGVTLVPGGPGGGAGRKSDWDFGQPVRLAVDVRCVDEGPSVDRAHNIAAEKDW
jgi:hypothetical protein